MRSISMEILHIVITDPDNQVIHQKVLGTYLYRVFVSKSIDPAVIITAYKSSKINKYGTDES